MNRGRGGGGGGGERKRWGRDREKKKTPGGVGKEEEECEDILKQSREDEGEQDTGEERSIDRERKE